MALSVGFSYGDPKDLVIAGATTLVGVAIAGWYLHVKEPTVVRGLRALHTGSVNDHTAFVTFRMVACVVALLR